jgi:hypothetical protein
MVAVKLFLSIIVGTSIMLSGLIPASGFSLLYGGKTQSVNRWSYGFGDRYIYDNAGSSWNYDSAYKLKDNAYRCHHRNRDQKYWHSRFKYEPQSQMDENFHGLIEHTPYARSPNRNHM